MARYVFTTAVFVSARAIAMTLHVHETDIHPSTHQIAVKPNARVFTPDDAVRRDGQKSVEPNGRTDPVRRHGHKSFEPNALVHTVDDPARREEALMQLTIDRQEPGLWTEEKGTVAPSCDGACEKTAAGGILFVGDSPIRRLYVRTVARLEGLTDAAAELLQYQTKDALKAAQKIAPWSDGDLNYTKGNARLRFAWIDDFCPSRIVETVNKATTGYNFHTVFLGFPMAHMLHLPVYPHGLFACHVGSNFAANISSRFKDIVDSLARNSSVRVIFGNAVPWAQRDQLTCEEVNSKVNCTRGACDWPQDNIGTKRANELHKSLFDSNAKPFMRYVDLFGETVKHAGWKSLGHPMDHTGSVHYRFPILDEQLTAIFAANTQ